MLDRFLNISARDFAGVKPEESGFNEVVAKFGHDACRLVLALGAIGRETR
jgi:cellobiose phosphorylase